MEEKRIYALMNNNPPQKGIPKNMKGEKEERRLWLPLQTIYNKELQVAEFLREQEIEYYIPMMYEARDLPSGECEHVLVPAIHNLLFIHREYDKDWCYKLLQTSPYPLYFLKKERDGREYCTISEKEMNNFMRATDPRIQGTRFIDPQKLKDKEGMPVRIIKKGPLFGITGKLMRYGSRHYVAINASEHRLAESQLHLVRIRL